MTDENKKIKLLLVDDDRFLLDMYSLKFKGSGVDIETASGSDIALTKLRAGEKMDIIILDIIMPTMDGLELLKIIRNEKLSPGATIVMLTNQPDEVKRAEEIGIDGYIVKATSIPSEVVSNVLDIYHNKHKK